jgi:hypothetical protein
MWMHIGVPVDSIRDAVFTVSPKKQYLQHHDDDEYLPVSTYYGYILLSTRTRCSLTPSWGFVNSLKLIYRYHLTLAKWIARKPL